MSKGDNLIGIPTIYKGIQMRSKLETKIAMFLDALNIQWQYEPKLFLLSDGTYYKPDFFLSVITYIKATGQQKFGGPQSAFKSEPVAESEMNRMSALKFAGNVYLGTGQENDAKRLAEEAHEYLQKGVWIRHEAVPQ